jgi:two-component system nitrate/nitrite sensor histidine kinase NarX
MTVLGRCLGTQVFKPMPPTVSQRPARYGQRPANADVREHILNLRTTPSPQRSFPDAVQEYLEGFSSNYEIETRCTTDRAPGDIPLAPESQMQLFRILQEALSNARKHGKARHVLVSLENCGGNVRMCIADDGSGFDVDAAAAAAGDHMGLRFMGERVEELGGNMQVESSRNEGTRVIVEVPRQEH